MISNVPLVNRQVFEILHCPAPTCSFCLHHLLQTLLSGPSCFVNGPRQGRSTRGSTLEVDFSQEISTSDSCPFSTVCVAALKAKVLDEYPIEPRTWRSQEHASR